MRWELWRPTYSQEMLIDDNLAKRYPDNTHLQANESISSALIDRLESLPLIQKLRKYLYVSVIPFLDPEQAGSLYANQDWWGWIKY